MEQWKLDALIELLNAEDVQFVEDTRAYISSLFYGKSRYHLVDDIHGNSVQIEQIDTDSKWGSRVVFQRDEVPALLKFLLDFYLEHERLKRADVPQETLGDLDDHPF